MNNFALNTFNEALRGRSGCLFCNPFEGMYIKNTQHFNVLADTFPVVPGHIMISSKDHYGCAGEIPEELQDELIKLKNDIAKAIKNKHENVIFYEHGRAGCCMSTNPDGSKCEHFHMHALPIDVDINESLQDMFNPIKIDRYNLIFENFYAYGNYLYFENNQGEMYFYQADDSKVQSHLLRTLICKEIDMLYRSDWQQYSEPEIWISSLQKVKEYDLS